MKTKLIIGGAAALLTGGLGYLAYRYFKGRVRGGKSGPDAPGFLPPSPVPLPASLPRVPAPTPGARPASPSPASSPKFPLRKGSRGPEVALVQRYLNWKHRAGLTVDGIWGNDTERALLAAGQPTSITESGFLAAQFAMKNLGVAGAPRQQRIL